MSKSPSLTYQEKVLLYLQDFIDIDINKPLPEDVTQRGIAQGVDMSRTHVSRVMRGLIDKGYVQEDKASVVGKDRKLKTYFLTQKGIEKSRDLYDELGKYHVKIKEGGRVKEICLSDIKEESDGKINLLDVFTSPELDASEEIIDLDNVGPKPQILHTQDKPEIQRLYGREEKIQKLRTWLSKEAPFAVLRGRKGIGTSCLVSKYVEEIEDRHILWIDISGKSLKNIKDDILTFLKEMEAGVPDDKNETDGKDENLPRRLNEKMILIVFNDYYNVDDEIVDFLSALLESSRDSCNAKYLLTTRGGIPAYEGFYHIDDIKEGYVKEFEVGSVNRKDAENILGKKIERSALKRIMQLTNGSPLLLKLLSEGEKERIIKNSPLSRSQVSLLMFLKDQERK